MLSKEKNTMLTQVAPGTPMGNLLRRYWMPIAGVSEFDSRATKPIRLMGEDLVLYKDLSGTYGLVDRRCSHRRADLAYGMVEKCGLPSMKKANASRSRLKTPAFRTARPRPA
jgi:5,5'-dehydrodivanillate O-demethylase